MQCAFDVRGLGKHAAPLRLRRHARRSGPVSYTHLDVYKRQGCGRAGRRARGGRFSICAERGPRGESPCGPLRVLGGIGRRGAAIDAAGHRPGRLIA